MSTARKDIPFSRQGTLTWVPTPSSLAVLLLDLHLVMDNYVTHKTETVQRFFVRHPRWHVHFTPTGSS